ncbi:L-tyrosine decarboxylase [Trifolium repens]|nr:L-tyrosine decarboxylase [Trifolium repens]KAK2389585.1 L-tyrosine decarboxylase [Trifolium repens]KAK2393652.1 L-tyrosine decarboxylase [Trifolium repens]KAK2415392.1 L-tyrosine decarboxylase [Trifolium repens]
MQLNSNQLFLTGIPRHSSCLSISFLMFGVNPQRHGIFSYRIFSTSEVVLVVLLAARDNIMRTVGRSALPKLVIYASDQIEDND